MNKNGSLFGVFGSIVALAGVMLFPFNALAQWDYGQDSTYNSIESRIDARKTRARIRARNAKRKPVKGKAAKSQRARSKTVLKAAQRPSIAAKNTGARFSHHNISFLRDTFQDFHLNDISGYDVTFTFSPTGKNAKPFTKTYNYSHLKYREAAEYNDLAPATYTVRATALYQGKKYPVHLASQDGTSANPKGGNFAPSIQLIVKAAKDNYGDTVIQGFPGTMYVRVID